MQWHYQHILKYLDETLQPYMRLHIILKRNINYFSSIYDIMMKYL